LNRIEELRAVVLLTAGTDMEASVTKRRYTKRSSLLLMSQPVEAQNGETPLQPGASTSPGRPSSQEAHADEMNEQVYERRNKCNRTRLINYLRWVSASPDLQLNVLRL